MRYDWRLGSRFKKNPGNPLPHKRVIDADTGEVIPFVVMIDEEAGIIERYVTDIDSLLVRTEDGFGLVTVIEERKVRIEWLDGPRDAEAIVEEIRERLMNASNAVQAVVGASAV